MKDKRNCNMNMGVPMMPYPNMPIPASYNVGYNNNPYMGYGNNINPYNVGYSQGYSNNSISSNTIEQQLNNMQDRISNLEQKVDRLESSINNSDNNKYNNSNYYMV